MRSGDGVKECKKGDEVVEVSLEESVDGLECHKELCCRYSLETLAANEAACRIGVMLSCHLQRYTSLSEAFWRRCSLLISQLGSPISRLLALSIGEEGKACIGSSHLVCL